MLEAGFVAAVLEGFEGTLDEVVGRVASPELRAGLAVLQTRQSTQSFDRTARSKDLGVLPGAPVMALPTSKSEERR